jgi:hypothetical protein
MTVARVYSDDEKVKSADNRQSQPSRGLREARASCDLADVFNR